MDQQAFALHHQRGFVGALPVSLVPLVAHPDLSKFALQAPAPLRLCFEGLGFEAAGFESVRLGRSGLTRMHGDSVATLKLRAS